MPVLHVVVPIYNERNTLEPCLRRVLAVNLPVEWTMDLYLVDDHSEPDACEAVEALARRLQEEGRAVSLRRHEVNRGKGAALQTGFDAILQSDADDTDIVVIQDADLEYDPEDFPTLMQPILEDQADAVVGTRWGNHTELLTLKRRIHAWGNSVLTRLSNIMTGYRVSDMECCYKLLRINVLRRLRPRLTEESFGIEPQMVAGLARMGSRVVEVPVRYDPRDFTEGKKIGWIDGVRAIYVIARERKRGGARPRPAKTASEHAR